eukprot:g3974.t1
MLLCDEFAGKSVDAVVVKAALGVRNGHLFHNSHFHLTDDQASDAFGALVALLKDPAELLADPRAQQAVKTIEDDIRVKDFSFVPFSAADHTKMVADHAKAKVELDREKLMREKLQQDADAAQERLEEALAESDAELKKIVEYGKELEARFEAERSKKRRAKEFKAAQRQHDAEMGQSHQSYASQTASSMYSGKEDNIAKEKEKIAERDRQRRQEEEARRRKEEDERMEELKAALEKAQGKLGEEREEKLKEEARLRYKAGDPHRLIWRALTKKDVTSDVFSSAPPKDPPASPSKEEEAWIVAKAEEYMARKRRKEEEEKRVAEEKEEEELLLKKAHHIGKKAADAPGGVEERKGPAGGDDGERGDGEGGVEPRDATSSRQAERVWTKGLKIGCYGDFANLWLQHPERRLDNGGFGAVYQVQTEREDNAPDQRYFAVKRPKSRRSLAVATKDSSIGLRTNSGRRWEMSKAMQEEAQIILQVLPHENVLDLVNIAHVYGVPVLVTPWGDGGSLDKFLGACGKDLAAPQLGSRTGSPMARL